MGDLRTRRFYDDLADTYHLNYGDWPASVNVQGRTLHALIEDRLGPGPHEVYDCACGIGTQALGLLPYGHRVFGTDLSAVAVTRAAREAVHRGLRLPVAAADLRALPVAGGRFDVVVCADNALPHLLTPADLTAALVEVRRVLRPGGLFLASVRDYDAVLNTRPTVTTSTVTTPTVVDTDTGRVLTLQLWTWRSDGEHYDVEHLQLHDTAHGWSVQRRTATYWAIRRQVLTELLDAAGLHDVDWHEPARSGFFQPIVAATRPAT